MKIIDVIGSNDITPNISWWGSSQWYKWCWNETHIDLGPISIYNLKRKWFWKIIAFIIFPMRLFYHVVFAGGFRNYTRNNSGEDNEN